MVTTYTEPSTHVHLVFYCCLAKNVGTMKHVEYGTYEMPKSLASRDPDYKSLACKFTAL